MRLFYYLLFVFLSLLVSCAPLGTEEQDFHTLGGQGLNKEYELIYISLNEIERTPIQSVYPLFSDWVLNKSVIWN